MATKQDKISFHKDKFSVKEKKSGKESETEVDLKGLVAMLKGNKQLGEFGPHVVTYLTKDKVLERVSRAHYKITDRGKELLETYPIGNPTLLWEEYLIITAILYFIMIMTVSV